MDRKRKKGKDPVSAENTVNVPLTQEQKRKLDVMAEQDDRRLNDFMRRLIEQEWDRRQAAAASAA